METNFLTQIDKWKKKIILTQIDKRKQTFFTQIDKGNQTF